MCHCFTLLCQGSPAQSLAAIVCIKGASAKVKLEEEKKRPLISLNLKRTYSKCEREHKNAVHFELSPQRDNKTFLYIHDGDLIDLIRSPSIHSYALLGPYGESSI